MDTRFHNNYIVWKYLKLNLSPSMVKKVKNDAVRNLIKRVRI